MVRVCVQILQARLYTPPLSHWGVSSLLIIFRAFPLLFSCGTPQEPSCKFFGRPIVTRTAGGVVGGAGSYSRTAYGGGQAPSFIQVNSYQAFFSGQWAPPWRWWCEMPCISLFDFLGGGVPDPPLGRCRPDPPPPTPRLKRTCAMPIRFRVLVGFRPTQAKIF